MSRVFCRAKPRPQSEHAKGLIDRWRRMWSFMLHSLTEILPQMRQTRFCWLRPVHSFVALTLKKCPLTRCSSSQTVSTTCCSTPTTILRCRRSALFFLEITFLRRVDDLSFSACCSLIRFRAAAMTGRTGSLGWLCCGGQGSAICDCTVEAAMLSETTPWSSPPVWLATNFSWLWPLRQLSLSICGWFHPCVICGVVEATNRGLISNAGSELLD